MRLVCFMALLSLVLLTSASPLTAQEPAPMEDVPAVGEQSLIQLSYWVQVCKLVMAAGGAVVLFVVFVVWGVRGKLLRQARLNFAPWGLLEVGLLGLMWMLLRAAPITATAALMGWRNAGEISVPFTVGVEIFAAAVVLALALWMMHARYGLSAESLGFRRESSIAWALVLAVGGLLAIAPIQLALERIYQHFEIVMKQDVVRQLMKMSGFDLALACGFTVLVAPVFEEFLFRGVMQMGLRKYVGPSVAIVLTAIAFAGIHQPWPVSLALLPLALTLGYLYQRRQSLLAPIVLHVLFNATTVAVIVANRVWGMRPEV